MWRWNRVQDSVQNLQNVDRSCQVDAPSVPFFPRNGSYVSLIMIITFTINFFQLKESSSSLTWIIVWSRKHQDDEPDPSVDGPNYGITSIDDIPDWDKQLMSKMSDDFFDSVSRCAIHLGVKPLVKLLTKETFCRFPDTVAVESISHASPLQWLNMPPVLVYNPAIRSDYRSRNIDFRCDDGSKVANCPVKAMMKWRSVSKFFITPDDGDDCILNRLDVLRRIPKGDN